jgi:hypothetical protein
MPQLDDDTLVHIAGLVLNIYGRIIQRCSLCGAKLADSKGCSMPVTIDYGNMSDDEKMKWLDNNFPTWPIGRLIEVCVGNPTRYLVLPDSDKLPKNSCIDFI